MINDIRSYLRRRKYGEPVYVVSGLPRSGTSMMMKMLDSGGIKTFTDGERVADIDNPNGYYEFERVKNLEKDTDRAWVKNARGQALKVISFLIRFLPADNEYRIIYMRRDLDEILASQDKMLDRLGTKGNVALDAEMTKEAYRNDIIAARLYARKMANMALLEVNYKQTVEDPKGTAHQLNEFLDGRLNLDAMIAAVDAKLYRNRA